jgi:hypothetical protein
LDPRSPTRRLGFDLTDPVREARGDWLDRLKE